MDARTYFLMLHEEAHTRGKAVRVFTVPTPEQWRALLPGHNSSKRAKAPGWGSAEWRRRGDAWSRVLLCHWPDG